MKSETRFCNCTTLGDSVKSIKSSCKSSCRGRFFGAPARPWPMRIRAYASGPHRQSQIQVITQRQRRIKPSVPPGRVAAWPGLPSGLGVLEELRRKIPSDDKGRLKKKLFQGLRLHYGHPKLREQL